MKAPGKSKAPIANALCDAWKAAAVTVHGLAEKRAWRREDLHAGRFVLTSRIAWSPAGDTDLA